MINAVPLAGAIVQRQPYTKYTRAGGKPPQRSGREGFRLYWEQNQSGIWASVAQRQGQSDGSSLPPSTPALPAQQPAAVDSVLPSSGRTRPSPLAFLSLGAGREPGRGGACNNFSEFPVSFSLFSHSIFYLLHFSFRKRRSPALLMSSFPLSTCLFGPYRFLFSVWKLPIIAIYTLSPKPICAN